MGSDSRLQQHSATIARDCWGPHQYHHASIITGHATPVSSRDTQEGASFTSTFSIATLLVRSKLAAGHGNNSIPIGQPDSLRLIRSQNK